MTEGISVLISRAVNGYLILNSFCIHIPLREFVSTKKNPCNFEEYGNRSILNNYICYEINYYKSISLDILLPNYVELVIYCFTF